MNDLQQLHQRIDHNMTNHAPTGEGVIERFEELRVKAKEFAHLIADLCPPSREQSLSLTAAEEALMWAVAAVARNQAAV